jgi:hypothetical protein
MENIARQEGQDLARSLPWSESTSSWEGAVFLVAAVIFALWVLNRAERQ